MDNGNITADAVSIQDQPVQAEMPSSQTETQPDQIAKKTAKDSVFRDLFENPKYLLQLYQSLHPEDTETTQEQIGSVTIKNVLLDQMYNDLGFTVGSKLLLLVEAQSTWSVNIVVRVLLYLASTWQEYIESNKLNVYGSKKVSLPKPELYVIYTGDRKDRPEWISLSEEFFPEVGDAFVDMKVKVIYDGQKGDIINQYVTFTKVYNEQVKLHGRTRKAVLETIRICKDRDVLTEYLRGREKEVIDIMMTLFEQEYAVERYGDEKKAEGEMKAKQETALNMKKKGYPDTTIADILEVGVATLQKWFSEKPTVAR